MKNYAKAEGIILSTTAIFDADRSYLIFTRELGKIRARAKGVSRPKSKLAGHLLAFIPTKLELVKTGEFWLITQATCLEGAVCETGIEGKQALHFIQTAEVLSESVNFLLPDNAVYESAYDGMKYTLNRLRNLSEGQESAWLVLVEFLWKLLDEMGMTPDLEHCRIGGEKLGDEPLIWSSALGGMIAQSNYVDINKGSNINLKNKLSEEELGLLQKKDLIFLQYPRTLLVLRQFLRPQFVGEKLNITPLMQAETIHVVMDYLQYQIGRPLRSYQIVKNLIF